MKLRSQISMLLFMFGMVPLLVAFAINVPMIFDRIQALYHKAHLQNLRAEFVDLDQHIARRNEMARLFAKIPEPGMIAPPGDEDAAKGLVSARKSYVEWVNQVLVDQLDITQILYLDEQGETVLWLDRNHENGRFSIRKHGDDSGLDRELLAAGLGLQPGNVMAGPIEFDRSAGRESPHRYMQMTLLSPSVVPVVDAKTGDITERRGLVVLFLDMGGLANAYRGNYWVHDDGRYLGFGIDDQYETTAFEDFRGLQRIFESRELGLWEFGNQQVIWVPLFKTDRGGTLWVGRSVDPSPLAALRHTVEVRIALVALGLLLLVLLVAWIIAIRVEKLGHELTDGISGVLEKDNEVYFDWRRPEELRELGNNLTRLAQSHAEHNRALHKYAKELEESNRFKSEFLANVSHELRTPLNSILLLSKMLAAPETGLTNEERRQASVIHDAGADLKALIDNILELSRIEAQQMALVEDSVNLRELLTSVLELMQPQISEKQLQLITETDTDVPGEIRTDRDKLRQIIINFLSNAVKFTGQGSITVRLAAGTDSAGTAYPVAISVTDTGIGIAEDKQSLVFEAFKQADGSTSRRYGGTGLGLTISRELAWLMGGDIEVQSSPGKGSTFTLFLPSEPPATTGSGRRPDESEQQTQERAARTVPDAYYPGARVLLVDDDMRNLLALTPLLERWGLDVMAAGDGEEALETLASAGDFDVVFMDIMMPGMDGYEVMQKIREKTRWRQLPVIALTARAARDDLARAHESGADDCIVKPVDPLELKNILDRYLK